VWVYIEDPTERWTVGELETVGGKVTVARGRGCRSGCACAHLFRVEGAPQRREWWDTVVLPSLLLGGCALTRGGGAERD
jgi:hypothetical protein